MNTGGQFLQKSSIGAKSIAGEFSFLKLCASWPVKSILCYRKFYFAEGKFKFLIIVAD